MQIDTQSITDAARDAILTVNRPANRRLNSSEFKSACAAAVSRLGQTKGAEIEGLASAVRKEDAALLEASKSALLEGMALVSHSKSVSVRLTAEGSSASASAKYSRIGTNAETVKECRRILGLSEPDADASEITRANHFARQRLARARLCELDAAFALAESVRLAAHAATLAA